jgi:hypothetical protein
MPLLLCDDTGNDDDDDDEVVVAAVVVVCDRGRNVVFKEWFSLAIAQASRQASPRTWVKRTHVSMREGRKL